MLDGEDKIVRRAVKGEASAFGLLYDYYQPKIYRFVLFKVDQREEAEDLTHQVFLHAWQRIREYRDFGFPFSSWLYRIARNQIIDLYRTNKNDASLEEIPSDVFVTPAVAHLTAERNLEFERVGRALRKLKSEYQDVILMRFIEELSPKEISATLGKSIGAIKLIQHRALKELKKILTE